MKILLIHPNKFAHRYASVGISMISSVLKKAGHDVLFFDTSRFQEETNKNGINYSEKSITKMGEVLQFLPVDMPPIKRSKEFVISALHSTIKSFHPDLMGFSATSSEFPYAANIVKEVKRYRIPIIVGGIHSTVAPLDVLERDGIDMAMVGEGEAAIVELTDAMASGRLHTNIKNIWFKVNNRVIRNDARPYIRNLDGLPFMDIEMFDSYHHMGAYQGRLVTYARVEAARGCPYKCTYCVNGTLHDTVYSCEKNHIRYKSPKRIVKELKFVNNKIRFDIVRFVDESFTVGSIQWLEEFVGLYRREIDKPLIVATRPEMVTKKKMNILRMANKHIQITMGIESGSERIRKQILNRSMSNETIINAFRLCDELGFTTAAFNMIGLPTETREDFFETIKLNIEAGVDIPLLSYFYPFIGSQLRDFCIREGYIDGRYYEIDYSISNVLKLPNFDRKEIEGLRRTFVMYVKMDKSLYVTIKKAEQSSRIFKNLVDIYLKTHKEPLQ